MGFFLTVVQQQFDKISTDSASRGPCAVAELLVKILENIVLILHSVIEISDNQTFRQQYCSCLDLNMDVRP